MILGLKWSSASLCGHSGNFLPLSFQFSLQRFFVHDVSVEKEDNVWTWRQNGCFFFFFFSLPLNDSMSVLHSWYPWLFSYQPLKLQRQRYEFRADVSKRKRDEPNQEWKRQKRGQLSLGQRRRWPQTGHQESKKKRSYGENDLSWSLIPDRWVLG